MVALFEDHGAAAAAATRLQAARPSLEPRVLRLTTNTPFASAGRVTLAVRTTDDRAVAGALAAERGVDFVYRAGAWTNEFIKPRVA